MRAVQPIHQLHGLIGVPAIHEDGSRSQQQRTLERIDGAANMTDWRRHKKRVPRLDQPMLAELADQRVDRVVRMKHTFGPASRARGEHHHSDRVGIEYGQLAPNVPILNQRYVGRVRAYFTPQNDHVWRSLKLRRDPAQHRSVVKLAKAGWSKDQPRIGVFQDEQQFAIAQRWQDGVCHHSGQGRREIDHGRLIPIGQHERYDATGRSPRQHRLGKRGRLIVECPTIEAMLAIDDEYAIRSFLRGFS